MNPQPPSVNSAYNRSWGIEEGLLIGTRTFLYTCDCPFQDARRPAPDIKSTQDIYRVVKRRALKATHADLSPSDLRRETQSLVGMPTVSSAAALKSMYKVTLKSPSR